MPSRPNKPVLLWLQGITCNGNAHSFLNLPWLAQLLARFELLYHPLLPSRRSLEAVAQCRDVCDVLVFEGTFDPELRRAGEPLAVLAAHYGATAKHVVAAGSCASFGGMFKASALGRGSGLAFLEQHRAGPFADAPQRVINLPGCPLHPEWLGYVLMMIADGEPVAVDALRRFRVSRVSAGNPPGALCRRCPPGRHHRP